MTQHRERRCHENPEYQAGHGGCLVCAPNSVERRKDDDVKCALVLSDNTICDQIKGHDGSVHEFEAAAPPAAATTPAGTCPQCGEAGQLRYIYRPNLNECGRCGNIYLAERRISERRKTLNCPKCGGTLATGLTDDGYPDGCTDSVCQYKTRRSGNDRRRASSPTKPAAEAPALDKWCCEGDGNGNHVKECRYAQPDYATLASPPAAPEAGRAREWTPAIENEWLRCKEGKVYNIACCDCALVHEIEFRVVDGRSEYRVRRNEQETEAKRNGNGPFWKQMAEEYLESAETQRVSKDNAASRLREVERERDRHAEHARSLATGAEHSESLLKRMAEAVRKAVERGCSCHSTNDDDWHTERCPIPTLRAVLSEYEKSKQ